MIRFILILDNLVYCWHLLCIGLHNWVASEHECRRSDPLQVDVPFLSLSLRLPSKPMHLTFAFSVGFVCCPGKEARRERSTSLVGICSPALAVTSCSFVYATCWWEELMGQHWINEILISRIQYLHLFTIFLFLIYDLLHTFHFYN